MSERVGLEPCPFCGSPDIDETGWRDDTGRDGPQCTECGATAENAAAWNRRTTPPATQYRRADTEGE